MPFTEPTPMTISVTQADINNASLGITTNSLSIALKRMRDAMDLPGIVNSTDVALCNVIQCYTDVSVGDGQTISIGKAYVCTTVYGVDAATALRILLENTAGIKPSAPYTATLNKLQS